MSGSGYRATGFMDGFMNGFSFVDGLQRADEERDHRRRREDVQDQQWQQLYGLRKGAQEQERQRDELLTPAQRASEAQLQYDDRMEALRENQRLRDFRDWQMDLQHRAAAAQRGPVVDGLQDAYGLVEGRTATLPQTGERLVYRAGRWEALK